MPHARKGSRFVSVGNRKHQKKVFIGVDVQIVTHPLHSGIQHFDTVNAHVNTLSPEGSEVKTHPSAWTYLMRATAQKEIIRRDCRRRPSRSATGTSNIWVRVDVSW